MLATRDDIMSTTASRRVDYDALAEIARLRAEKDDMAARMREMEDEQIRLRALANRRVSRRSLIIEGGEKIHYTQALRKAGEIVFRNEEYKGNAGAKDRAIKRRPGHVARTINNA